MKKYNMIITILLVGSFLFVACSEESSEGSAAKKSDESIPKEVVKDSETDPMELEDQMGLEMGETGYVITQSEKLPLAVTLNSVEKPQDVGPESLDGDRFYLIAEFTFKNLGDSHISVERPDVVPSSDESAVVNDELNNKGDLLGLGTWYLDENGEISEDNRTNTLSLEPGEEVIHKVGLSMRGSADEYSIFFGLYVNNNRDYQNKAGWTFNADEIEEK